MQNRKRTVMVFAVLLLFTAALCAVKNYKEKVSVPITSGENGSSDKMPGTKHSLNLFSSRNGQSDAIREAAGKYAENRYNNETFGISVVFDDGWYFFDADTRKAIVEETYGIVGREENGESIYDLYCEEKESNKSISIVIDDCEKIFGKEMTEEEYLKKTEEALGSNDMEYMEYTGTKKTYENVAIKGKKHNCLEASGRIGKTEIHQRFVAIKKGKLMMLITMTAPDEEELEIMQGMFK